ncbi:IS30 family transposase [Jannaschia formosa]|nr:IS30 family transposase [Jannaschia formosa]TFL15933.1 IS30 family transposase [Jannaschia formosa]
MAARRRHRRRKLVRQPLLLTSIVDRLRAGWSPEQIAGRLRRDGSGSPVCHETIYAWVCSDEDREGRLARFLPYRRKTRCVRLGRKPRMALFPENRSIHRRPDAVAEREEFGHWGEGERGPSGATQPRNDLMIFQRSLGKANVATVVERKTRHIALHRNEDRPSRRVLGRLAGLLGSLPAAARRSVTFDQGLEFRAWSELTKATGIDVWFCDPQAPHQKGAVENANGRVRRGLASETPVAVLAVDRHATLGLTQSWCISRFMMPLRGALSGGRCWPGHTSGV